MAHLFKRIRVLLTTLVAFAVLATPAQAQDQEYGYLWSLKFDFEQSFDAVLTIRVGPWEDGNLVAVDETSETRIRCTRSGLVSLDSGHAVFNGGHLVCPIDLATLVQQNHNLTINALDTYNSMLVQTRLQTTSNNVAPIFSHPNAAYTIDFTQLNSVTLNQRLWNGAGQQTATFGSIASNTMNTYFYQYGCQSSSGPCHAIFQANTQQQSFVTTGGQIKFATGPNSFLIGGNGSSSFFGRMDDLLIDPGNTIY
jgi:hypothetical protein